MKTIVKRAIRDQKGAALILALVLLVLGVLILAPLLGLMNTGILAGQVYEKKTYEYYAADGGVEDAIWKIVNQVEELPDSPCGNQSWSYDYEMLDINNRDVDITIEYPGDLTHLITSIAISDDGSSTTVQAHITLDVEIPSEWWSWDPEDWEIVWTEGEFVCEGDCPGDIYVDESQNVKVTSGGNITGNVLVENGNVVLENYGRIEGNVWAGGGSGHDINLGQHAVITGHICATQHVRLDEWAEVSGIAWAMQKVTVKDGAIIHGDVYGNEVEVLPGGEVTGVVYYVESFVEEGTVGGSVQIDELPPCPLSGGGIPIINGVSIGSWQIS